MWLVAPDEPSEVRAMNMKRAIQWLIPLLYGISLGAGGAWIVELLLPGRDAAATYASPFAIAAILVAVFLKLKTGYNWPWEGLAEWSEPAPMKGRTIALWLVIWLVIVLLLLAVFTLRQPH
jgi:hypothetical protein